ncbi:MAG: FAD-binding oxidoreductase [Baekduia sp.]
MSLEQALAEVVGPDHVLTDADIRAGYERDWTGRFGAPARCVVRPADTAEVAAVLRACTEHGVPVVPQGGNTGLVGGGVPRGGEVVLSFARLTEIGAVDEATGQISCGAGVTLTALQQACREHGADAGLDFGARDTATLGGIAACNAGGPRAIRYGTARARIAGLEAVLADGTVISRMNGLLKDNAGYDLSQLLIGSEGTLGVITAVRWRSVPATAGGVSALLPVDSVGEATAVLAALRRHAPTLEACEIIDARSLAAGCAHVGVTSPVADAPFVLLIDCGSTEELAAALGDTSDRAAIADDSAGRAALWAPRDRVNEAISALGTPIKLDVGVPVGRLGEFLDRLREDAYVFGHLGDGNLHVNVVGPDPSDHTVDDEILALALACSGTISAEHGVGVAKTAWLERCRGHAEVTAMRAIKRCLDPAGLLNPGAVLGRNSPDCG